MILKSTPLWATDWVVVNGPIPNRPLIPIHRVNSVRFNACYIVWWFVLKDTCPQNGAHHSSTAFEVNLCLFGGCGLINMDVTFRNRKTNAAQRTQSSSVTIITFFNWSFRRALFPLNQTLHAALFYLTHPRSPTLVCLSVGSVGQHNGLAMASRAFGLSSPLTVPVGPTLLYYKDFDSPAKKSGRSLPTQLNCWDHGSRRETARASTFLQYFLCLLEGPFTYPYPTAVLTAGAR